VSRLEAPTMGAGQGVMLAGGGGGPPGSFFVGGEMGEKIF